MRRRKRKPGRTKFDDLPAPPMTFTGAVLRGCGIVLALLAFLFLLAAAEAPAKRRARETVGDVVEWAK